MGKTPESDCLSPVTYTNVLQGTDFSTWHDSTSYGLPAFHFPIELILDAQPERRNLTVPTTDDAKFSSLVVRH